MYVDPNLTALYYDCVMFYLVDFIYSNGMLHFYGIFMMQQMEATRQAAEDAQRQHVDALRQLGENAAGAQMYGPHPQPPPPEWSLEDFLKHQPAKFDGKTSPD